MRKKVFQEAQKLDQLNAERQWIELVRILEENYLVKSNRHHEVLLNIFDDTNYSIGIELSGYHGLSSFVVRLWHNDVADANAPLNTLRSVIEVIDDFQDRIKYAKNKR